MAIKSKISKRQRFILVSLGLTVVFLLTQLVDTRFRYLMIGILAGLTYLFSALAIFEDVKGIEWLTLFALPTLFSFSIALFYFLLPVRWITRLPFALLYGVSIYAILLSENIFNVAAIRTIQLYQAALAITSLISIVTFFLFSNIILSFHLLFIFNFLLFFILSFFLTLINLWNTSLSPFLDKRMVKITFFLSLIIGEISFILSFWPTTPLVTSLFLTTIFYLLLGITQTYLLEKPLGNLIWEYTLFLFTFLILFLKSPWGG